MYLYLGQDTVINTKQILGIFDLDNTSVSRVTKGYLRQAQKNGWIVEVSEELPKSYVVCCNPDTGKYTVYLSQISPATLRKRASYVKDIANI